MVLKKQKDDLLNKDFSDEFYQILPINDKKPISNKRVLFERFELIQLIRDMLNINEATNWNFKASIHSKYKSIGSFIRNIKSESIEFSNMKNEIINSYEGNSLKILNIYEVLRPDESFAFKSELENQRRLFHGSKVNNFTGILSRGLLLPKIVVNDFGGTRSDIGLLGSGIYFSESLNTSLKYADKSTTKNTRLIAICDVALGNCKDYHDHDISLIKAPDGFNSTHGVKKTNENNSKFNDSEYVVYDTNQQRIRYVVELQLDKIDGDLKQIDDYSTGDFNSDEIATIKTEYDEIGQLEKGKNILEVVETCLMTNSGKKLPLKSVHVRAQIVDMVSKVVIYQEYENEENQSIEVSFKPIKVLKKIFKIS